MRIILLVIGLIIINLSNLTAQTFIVKKNQRQTITKNLLGLEEFVMEDNSTLVISGLASWELQAVESLIGNNCRIIADGTNGKNGKRGLSYTGSAKDCRSGSHGGNGKGGTSGRNGINIKIKTAFISLGNLYISTNGGKGGNGGNGGNGQQGGKIKWENGFKKCGGGHGGNAGYGGNAGKSGNGGNVNVEYLIFEDYYTKPLFSINNNNKQMGYISISVKKGTRGNAGTKGNPGKKGTGTDKKSGKYASNGKSVAEARPGAFNSIEINDDCLEDLPSQTNALIISVSNYAIPEPEWEIQTDTLYSTLSNLYDFDTIQYVKNPTADELRLKLIEIFNSGSQNNWFVYLSGHGVKYTPTAEFYGFLAADSSKISFSEIASIMQSSNLNSFLFLFDACYSGKMLDNTWLTNYSPTKKSLKKTYAVCGKRGQSIITAGYEEESVSSDMTKYLIIELKENKSLTITSETLFFRLVGEDKHVYPTQRPSFGKAKRFRSGDFIFHLK